ncbi:MAG: anti-sigma factor antagonist [Clostridiales bacterium]|nr:anti-sigma factor antagonist [Clostridiales bacterium]
MNRNRVSIVNEGERIIVYLSGEIDHYTASIIRGEIDSAIHGSAPSLLVLDFEKVSFMDSAGIGLIIGRINEMKRVNSVNDDNVIITNTNGIIESLISLAGLSRLISKIN